MRRLALITLAGMAAWAAVSSAETIILDEDFSSWTLGTIGSTYTLPSGWSFLATGLEITTENSLIGGQTLKSPSGNLGSIRFQWPSVDPTAAEPLKFVFDVRVSGSKIHKGFAILNSSNVAATCDPAIYLCSVTSSPYDERIRDRANCAGASSPAVYTTTSDFRFPLAGVNNVWVRYEIVCDDTGAELLKDGGSQGFFGGGGAPVGTLDNFVALDVGVPKESWWGGEYDPNGDIWFDRIQIIQGPFGPEPTPTITATPTITPTPVTFGRIVYEDFEGAEWPVGTITDVYTMPPGWTAVTYGAQITTARDHTYGTGKSLVSADSSSGCVQLRWTAIDPTAANPFVFSFWAYKSSGKMEKGVALLNKYGISGCAPMIYWYTNTLDSTLTRVRDRENCAVPPAYSSVYGPTPTQFQIPQDEGAWHQWEFVGTELGAQAFKDGISLGTFSGAPNADMDNFSAIELGRPVHAWSGDFTANGSEWFDDIYIAVGGAATGVEQRDWASY